jgi:hypothetical protein
MLTMLYKAKDHFLEGGKLRMKYTIVPIVFKSLVLVQKVHKAKDTDADWEKKAKKVGDRGFFLFFVFFSVNRVFFFFFFFCLVWFLPLLCLVFLLPFLTV